MKRLISQGGTLHKILLDRRWHGASASEPGAAPPRRRDSWPSALYSVWRFRHGRARLVVARDRHRQRQCKLGVFRYAGVCRWTWCPHGHHPHAAARHRGASRHRGPSRACRRPERFHWFCLPDAGCALRYGGEQNEVIRFMQNPIEVTVSGPLEPRARALGLCSKFGCNPTRVGRDLLFFRRPVAHQFWSAHTSLGQTWPALACPSCSLACSITFRAPPHHSPHRQHGVRHSAQICRPLRTPLACTRTCTCRCTCTARFV